MRGGPRRNKPEPLRTLHGSRKRPRHRPSVPLLPVGTLDPPAGLTPMELGLWAYYVPLLAGVRVLTDVDRDCLANHVIGLAQVREIRALQQAPSYRRLAAKRTHPLDAQLRAWLQLTRLSAAELGLSPVSRARVASAGPAQEIDELEAFIKAPLRRVK
jgi:phage terminase small subunit